MEIIDPSVEIIKTIEDPLGLIELAGRTCYKSEDKITDDSKFKFAKMIRNLGHLSVFEHSLIVVKFICSRACSHQLVRSRIASYSQESQRYCDYNKKGLTFIKPEGYDDRSEKCKNIFIKHLTDTEKSYKLLKEDLKSEDAREILPNCSKTEVVVSMNFRSWRHFLEIRTDIHAQKEIRGLAKNLLSQFKKEVPVVFDDIN